MNSKITGKRGSVIDRLGKLCKIPSKFPPAVGERWMQTQVASFPCLFHWNSN